MEFPPELARVGTGGGVVTNTVKEPPSWAQDTEIKAYVKNAFKPTLSVGVKLDNKKVRYDLIPTAALKEIAKVLQHGATKYEDRNWEKGLDFSRCYRAAIGHLIEWWDRKDLDPESGESHLAEAATNLMFLLHYTQHPELYKAYDNRPNYADTDNSNS